MGNIRKKTILDLSNRLCIVVFTTLMFFITTEAVFSQSTNQQGKKRITGIVTDTNNEPLVGATIQVLNSSSGTITNIDGLYVIDASDSDVLSFSYVGI